MEYDVESPNYLVTIEFSGIMALEIDADCRDEVEDRAIKKFRAASIDNSNLSIDEIIVEDLDDPAELWAEYERGN